MSYITFNEIIKYQISNELTDKIISFFGINNNLKLKLLNKKENLHEIMAK